MTGPRPLVHRAAGWRDWLHQTLSPKAPNNRSSLVFASALVFLVAIGVRLLQWQDAQVEITRRDAAHSGLEYRYRYDAEQISGLKSLLLPDERPDPGDARLIVHPPGYPALIASLYRSPLELKSYVLLRAVQIALDSLSAVLILLLTSRLLPLTVATLAGMLAALSPHLAYYSLSLTPESIAVVPILFALYLIVLAVARPRMSIIVVAGMAVGLSCWFRSNGLLLGAFLAVTLLLRLDARHRWRFAVAFLSASILVVAPITIRNWLLYHRFVPLSVGAGVTLIEGIADYDHQQRFDLPPDDEQAALKDAEWYGRSDYAGNLWEPDGPQRDSARFARGLEVIRDNPVWFLGVMVRRAAFMLRYNDSGPTNWPLNTAIVPIVLARPGFSHNPTASVSDSLKQVWSSSPSEFLSNATVLSPNATTSLAADGSSLDVTGDDTSYGDQFISTPISVDTRTDYVLRLAVTSVRGLAAAKVTTADRQVTLSASPLRESGIGSRRDSKSSRKTAASDSVDSYTGAGSEKRASIIDVPFASGDSTSVRIVLSNNGTSSPVVTLGRSALFVAGPTSYIWTRPLRVAIRALQRHIYTTGRLVPLIAAGVLLIGFGRLERLLLVLLSVPAYYLVFQSAFHTEYRYILAIHYYLFAFAGVSAYIASRLIVEGYRGLKSRLNKGVSVSYR